PCAVACNREIERLSIASAGARSGGKDGGLLDQRPQSPRNPKDVRSTRRRFSSVLGQFHPRRGSFAENARANTWTVLSPQRPAANGAKVKTIKPIMAPSGIPTASS